MKKFILEMICNFVILTKKKNYKKNYNGSLDYQGFDVLCNL
jgi:hypothetical protein